MVSDLQLLSRVNSRSRLQHKCRGCPLPALSMFRPDRYFGSIPEKLDTRIASFLQSDAHLLTSPDEEGCVLHLQATRIPPPPPPPFSSSEGLSVEKFESLIHFKYLQSLAQPGEAVGLLASQVQAVEVKLCLIQLCVGPVHRRTVHTNDIEHIPLCRQRRNECHSRDSSTQVGKISCDCLCDHSPLPLGKSS